MHNFLSRREGKIELNEPCSHYDYYGVEDHWNKQGTTIVAPPQYHDFSLFPTVEGSNNEQNEMQGVKLERGKNMITSKRATV